MEELMQSSPDVSTGIFIIKTFIISICTYYTFLKILNYKIQLDIKMIFIMLFTIIIDLICVKLKILYNYYMCIGCLLILLSIVYAIMTKEKLKVTIIVTTIALSINYVICFLSIVIDFVIAQVFNIEQDYINLCIISLIHIVNIYILFNIRRLRNGLIFFKSNVKNEYFNVFILNIGISLLYLSVILTNYDILIRTESFYAFITLTIIMFIGTERTLVMYYKHKLLVADLEETKAELANKEKEIEELEKENLEISKTSHTISHKIKSLEFKINDLKMGKELADEIDLSDRIKEISKEYYRKNTAIKLDKTDIEEIDDMLKYMQSRCINNDIEFELQLNGSIHYMVNNVIPKEDLETLLADHIKDAIIAVNHSSNINKSILVRLGLIDGVYSVYIYDSGIEFEEKTLLKIGKEPITTHKDEGGTGMGFMNTFDTLKKYKASMIINEIGKPDKDNYTKSIIIKFDNKNEFKINSYRKIAITQ